MKGKPFVGQKVHLNDQGLEDIFGVHQLMGDAGIGYMKTKVLTITAVNGLLPIDDAASLNLWDIELDDAWINMRLFTSDCFTEV